MFLGTPSRNVSQSGECLSAWLCTYSSTTDSLGRLQGAETERGPREKVQKGGREGGWRKRSRLSSFGGSLTCLLACSPSPPLADYHGLAAMQQQQRGRHLDVLGGQLAYPWLHGRIVRGGIFKRHLHTEVEKMACTWFGEICYCCS